MTSSMVKSIMEKVSKRRVTAVLPHYTKRPCTIHLPWNPTSITLPIAMTTIEGHSKPSVCVVSTRTDEVGTWLKFHGLWNKARTKATVSLFSIPRGLPLCHDSDSATVGTESLSYDFANVVSSLEGDRGLTCRACNLVFTQPNEQHVHFKSDLHRINLKRSLRGLAPLHDDSVMVHGTTVGTITGQEDEEEEATDDILASAEDYLDGTAADYSGGGGPDELKSQAGGSSYRGGMMTWHRLQK